MQSKSHKRGVNAYVRGVVSGKIVAGELVRAACQRHLDDLRDAKKKGLRFDEKLANRAIDFFAFLQHSTGEYAGQPFELMPFQKFIIWSIFGWRRVSDGLRRFRRALVSFGSGNGKSPLAAGIILLCLLADSPLEPRAECYVGATKESQAKPVLDEIRRFRAGNPELAALVEDYKSGLFIPSLFSSLQPLSCEGTVDDGLVPHIVVFDEYHQLREHHREQVDIAKSKMAKRRQPLFLVITTAGDENSKLWIELDTLASRVVERGNGIEADDLFVFNARIDDDDDPLDEDNWPKANPLLEYGVVKIEAMRSMAADARVAPNELRRFTRYNCNRKVTSAAKVVTAKMIETGDQPLPGLDGLVCHAGFDWGWKDDLTALGYVFPLEPTEIEGEQKRRVAVLLDAWIPQNGGRDLTLDPWATWIKDGWLQVTPGEITDTEAIYARLDERRDQFGIATIAMDPNNAREFGSRVQTDYGIEAFWFGQTCGKYNEATRELLCMLREGRLLHGGNPVLAWALQNMVLKYDHREYAMPDKENSEDKIDPAVAVIMGISECLFEEREPVHSYYEENDVEAC